MSISYNNYNWTRAVQLNGYTIERGFARGWDKDFAHPTQPWTLPKSETDEFMELKRFITIQTVMEKVFFETEQQIILYHIQTSIKPFMSLQMQVITNWAELLWLAV